jgi:hypothetical protein
MVGQAGQAGSKTRDRRRRLDAELDEALAQTFPASDPFSVGRFTATEPPSRPVDAKAPLPRRRRSGRAGPARSLRSQAVQG